MTDLSRQPGSRASEAVASPRRAPVWPALVLILVLAACLRFWRLGGKSFWMDEAASVHLAAVMFDPAASERGTDLIGRYVLMVRQLQRHDAHPPLYQTVLFCFVEALGAGEAAARLPSALAGLATVLLLYRLGARLYDRGVGLAAAGLAAVSAILVYLSQEARLHSLLVAITVAHANALVDVVWPRGRPRLAWVLYALLGVAGLWTYAPYGAALAGHWAFYALYGRRERGAVSRFVAAQVVIAASLLPWLPTLQAVTARVSASLVSRPQDLRPLRAEQVAVAALSAPAGLSYARWTFQSGLTALTALGWGVGLWCAFRGSVRRAEQGGRLWPLLVVPVAAYLMTPTPRVHEFELKHVVFLVPFALLACAAAVVRPTGRRWIGALLGGVLAVLNLGDALCYLSPGFEKEPWRSIVAEIKGRSTPGDFVMVNPSYAQAPYRVYGRRGPPVVGAPERFDEAMITQLRPDFRRVWLVEVASRVARPLDVPGEWLDRHWRPAGEARVYPGYLGVVLLRLYERHTAATPE